MDDRTIRLRIMIFNVPAEGAMFHDLVLAAFKLNLIPGQKRACTYLLYPLKFITVVILRAFPAKSCMMRVGFSDLVLQN